MIMVDDRDKHKFSIPKRKKDKPLIGIESSYGSEAFNIPKINVGGPVIKIKDSLSPEQLADFRKKWDENIINIPHMIPMTKPLNPMESKNDIIFSDQNSNETLRFVIGDEDKAVQTMTVNIKDRGDLSMKLEINFKLIFDKNWQLSKSSIDLLKLMVDINKDTRKSSSYGRLQRRLRRCYEGNSCLSCNNARFLTVYMKRTKKGAFGSFPSNSDFIFKNNGEHK